ncbi:MAG: ABC transporter ATP-binding protein [Clostridia bacterium]|nr:ABC transporter ATP-binding protein [Clostridia bacterium]
MEPIISVKNLSKRYKVFGRKKDIIVEAMFPKANRHSLFTAVDNMSFDVYPGESVGVLGCNGAGKSTLLKMITGVVAPTEGEIKLGGRVSSLLELGTAFNPELTGVENIYQHGQIFGLTNAEIKAREQEIIDFADIGDHINQPVKTYSSGMFARLAFACAINVDPDILIVDEVLSVGDMAFQMKCFKKFEQFKERKKTILFVSHNVNDILTNCTRALILQQGRCIFDGDAKEGVERYKKLMSGIDMNENRNGETGRQAAADASVELSAECESGEMKKNHELNGDILIYGNQKAEIIDYGLFGADGKPTNSIKSHEQITIRMKVKFNEPLDEPIFAVGFKNAQGLELCGVNTFSHKVETGHFDKGQTADVKFSLTVPLATNKYSVSFGCTSYNDDGALEIYCRHYDAFFIDIAARPNSVGLFDLESRITIER